MDRSDDPWWICVLGRCRTAFHYMLLATMATFQICLFQALLDEKNVAKFSVDLTAFKGLNSTIGRTVSPGFRFTAKIENPRAWQAWCSSGGDLVVSYAGVSLAWGRIPDFCVARKGALELSAAVSGRAVGLSDELRSRFATEWNRGTTTVVVQMKLFYDGNGWPSTHAYNGVSLVRRELGLQSQGALVDP